MSKLSTGGEKLDVWGGGEEVWSVKERAAERASYLSGVMKRRSGISQVRAVRSWTVKGVYLLEEASRARR